MLNEITVLFVGDIVGAAGRKILSEKIAYLLEFTKAEFVIANAENAAGGLGVTPQIADELFSMGIDVLTSGNHIWDKKEIVSYIEKTDLLLRPDNYPPGVPGHGVCVVSKNVSCFDGVVKIGVINVMGRVFMNTVDCPFRVLKEDVEYLKPFTNVIIVDFHAEATSEKIAMGWYMDGEVSAVIGTHTHVQTADERILPKGTAYITDVGMTGAVDSVIGIKKDLALQRFLTQMPVKYQMAKQSPAVNAVSISVNISTGKAQKIQRIKLLK